MKIKNKRCKMFKYKNKFFLIITFLSILHFSCRTDLDEIRALTHEEELPDVIVENLISLYSINGNTQVKLSTPKAYRYTSETKQYSLFPSGVTLLFFDNKMNLHSSLIADYAIFYEKKNFAKAQDNVILTNVDGSILRTEELYLDEKEEKIYSVVPVKIEDKDGFEITGKGGFESNLDFTVYKFTDVSGVKIINDDDGDIFSEDDNKIK